MKTTCVLASIFVLSCRASFALYSPDTERVDVAVSTLACQQAKFMHDQAIVQALRGRSISGAMAVLPGALAELKGTPTAAPLYSARAFCVHELVPSSLERNQQSAVTRLKNIGLNYFYYEPDARWFIQTNPTDLVRLATDYLNSRWGRQAFLMMTQLGWSLASCREGPDQFYTVIKRGQAFLQRFPNSEVSNDVRLAVADSYATWWNLSRNPPKTVELGPTHDYRKGADNAKLTAIQLYRGYLTASRGEQTQPGDAKARERITRLQQDPKGTQSWEHYCPDYED